jgi:hypothetical protein
MVTRTILLTVVLILVAFGVFEWQQNARLERELTSLHGKLTERDAAQERSVHPATEPEDPQIALLRRQNVALSNRVNRLEAELVAARRSRDQVSAQASMSSPEAATEDVAHRLALAVLQGDLAALDTLAEMTRGTVSAHHRNMTPDEQEKYVANLRPIWAAFDMLAEEASQGNENALQALAKTAKMPDLSGLAIKSLGELAGRGSEGALNVVLDPQRFGIDIPFASTVRALKPAAESGNPRAVEALAAVAANDNQQPLWFMAADALGKAAESGNSAAIEALISFSRSTNQSALNAVRAGLSAAAANQNARAIEALRELSARHASP